MKGKCGRQEGILKETMTKTKDNSGRGSEPTKKREPACPLPVWCLQNEGAVLRMDTTGTAASIHPDPFSLPREGSPHGAKLGDNKLLTACQLVQLIG